MKKRFLLIAWTLVISHALTELHTIIYWADKNSVNYMVKWFIRPITYDVNILWYCKMLADSLLYAAMCFAGASQSFTINYDSYLQWQRYSGRLFAIWVIFALYHFYDLFMFFYNYKQSYAVYIITLCVSLSAAIYLMFPVKRKSPRN